MFSFAFNNFNGKGELTRRNHTNKKRNVMKALTEIYNVTSALRLLRGWVGAVIGAQHRRENKKHAQACKKKQQKHEQESVACNSSINVHGKQCKDASEPAVRSNCLSIAHKVKSAPPRDTFVAPKY